MKLSQIIEWHDDEEYIKEEWTDTGSLIRVLFRYIMPGYKINPAHEIYAIPGEFGSLELESDDKDSEHMYVSGVHIDKPFRNKGYGSELYRHALTVIKNKGYKGILSYHKGRTSDADRLWRSLGGKDMGEYDVLEDRKKLQ